MPDILIIILAGIFLPIFPISMVFNAILDKSTDCWIKALLIIVWPLIGLFIVIDNQPIIPGWLVPLALFTSALYALRMLTLREVNQWTGFLATSIWSLLWLAVAQENDPDMLYGYAVSMSVPLVMLAVLSKGLEARFGAAYTGLYGGLARTIPRFSGILIIVIIASVATPLFPTFFFMFDMVIGSISAQPFATAMLLVVWLLWSWAGALLIQGLIVGRASKVKILDMEMMSVVIYSCVLFVLLLVGIYQGGLIL